MSGWECLGLAALMGVALFYAVVVPLLTADIDLGDTDDEGRPWVRRDERREP